MAQTLKVQEAQHLRILLEEEVVLDLNKSSLNLSLLVQTTQRSDNGI
jgi:hypothetical protein